MDKYEYSFCEFKWFCVENLESQIRCYNVMEQGLWLRLLKLGPTEDPLSSFEYGTILGKVLENCSVLKIN